MKLVTLKRHVKKEADLLRKNATKEELNKLDIETLDPELSSVCIYGQMTENCYSGRAKELMEACAVAVTDYGGLRLSDNVMLPRAGKLRFGERRKTINKFYPKLMYPRRATMTAIEHYITLKFSKKGNLIDYLQGKVSILAL